MTSAYSLEGFLVLLVLFVCSCAYISRIPRLRTWMLSDRKGFFGLFRKGAVIALRLNFQTALAAVALAVYILLR